MNIINIIQCTNLGGTERGSLQLMAGLQRRQHRCRVLSLNPLGRFAPILRNHNISVEGLPYRGRGGVFSAPLLYRRLRTIKADAMIMTGHNFLAMTSLGDLWKGRRVLTMHYHHTGVKSPWQWRAIYQIAQRRFQAITFNSDFIRMEAESLCPSIAPISHTVRYPITVQAPPSEDERSRARESLGIAPSARVIGNASWLIPRKRFDVFLRVAAKVLQHEKNAVFLIAGDGPEYPTLRRLSEELGIAERIRWLGWQEETRTFYQCLDVLLFNSDWEAMSLTALEAMSYGIPVVASILHGGLKEILLHETHGFLFSSHDVDQLCDAVRRGLEIEGKRVGMAGRERVKQCCDPEQCVRAVENLIMAS